MSLELHEEKNRDIPVPIQIIACQDLLSTLNDYRRGGWLYKSSKLTGTLQKTKDFLPKKVQNILQKISWDHRFIVLRKGCIYCFVRDDSEKPRSCYSLYGFNKISRVVDTEMTSGGLTWMFKIEPAFNDMKTLYFYASSELDMKKWMQSIRNEMLLIRKRLSGNGSEKFEQELDECEKEYGEMEEPLYAAQQLKKLDRQKTIMIENVDQILPAYTGSDDNDEMDKNPTPPARRRKRLQEPSGKPELQPREKGKAETMARIPDIQSRSKQKKTPPTSPSVQTLAERVGAVGLASSEQANQMPPDVFTQKIEKTKASNKRRRPPVGGVDVMLSTSKVQSTTVNGRRPVPPQTHNKPEPNKKPTQPSVDFREEEEEVVWEEEEKVVWDDDAVWDRERALFKTGVMAHAIWDGTKENAEARLQRIQEPGVYLIRDGSRASDHQIDKTLCVLGQENIVKYYKIRLEHDGHGNVSYYLKTLRPLQSAEELLTYYTENELPNSTLKLTVPHSYYTA